MRSILMVGNSLNTSLAASALGSSFARVTTATISGFTDFMQPPHGRLSMRSILMVGNSLASANNMPQTLASILDTEVVAITRGGARLAEFSNEKTRTGQRVREALSFASILDTEVVAITRGGARLAEFSNEKTRTGQCVREALSSGGFALVIMQDMSHLAATNPAAHVRSVAAMSKLARSHDASPLLYGTWGYQVGCPRLEKLGMTAEEMCELMSVGDRRTGGRQMRHACRWSTWRA